MRVIIGPKRDQLDRQIKHDDVVIVPEFFCKEDDWSIYYKLVEEMRESQASGLNKSEWISWHEGAHLISMNPTGSPTFNGIQEKISKYFGINNKAVGTRFNWYKDGSDWKPFHHDSAAFNPQRARNQNITVGVSFGSSRELSFLHAKDGSRIYFPQNNGMMFSFGRDVNLKWKHGINALSEEEISAGGTNTLGRVSIILWGLCPMTIEEEGSPPLLVDNTRGNGHSVHARPHDHRKDGHHKGNFSREDQLRDNHHWDDHHRDDHRRDDYRGREKIHRDDHRRDDFRRGEQQHHPYQRDERRDFRRVEHRSDQRDDYNGGERRDDGKDSGGGDRVDRRGDSRDRGGGREGGRDNDRECIRDSDRERRSPARRERGMDGELESARSQQQHRVEKRAASPIGGAGGGGAPVCRDFRRGSCRFGDRCKFQHCD